MVVFTNLLRLLGSTLVGFINAIWIGDLLTEALIHLYFSNVSVLKNGKLRANVYVLTTSKPADYNRYVDDFIAEYNLLPGRKIIRVSESIYVRSEYELHSQLKIHQLRALVEVVNGG